ncbi:MAG: cohesin domain-containing protein [Candidatus Paceibacterota bacterium]|jgi:hypothetical protein
MKRFILILFFVIVLLPSRTSAATLSITPATGTFIVGSTFDVSIVLNTSGKSINALAVSLQFPPNMLQVVSPSTGESIIGVWTSAPKYNNLTGKIDLQGGIPGGITASGGLISHVTFRVKSVGEAVVKFLDNSKVLLNDGLGTNVLTQTNNSVYQLKLPAPAGPSVFSETNPDQATWYSNKTASFRFINESIGVDGYSYILSDEPTTIPDDISEGTKNSVSYSNLSDGVHYFHVKALRNKSWGGTTHFSIKIDTTPPADFKIDIIPSVRTTSKQPIIQYSTTDTLSGTDRYELKIISLLALGGSYDSDGDSLKNNDTFFIEQISPYAPPDLDFGLYDVIVRAYDHSNNYKEVTQRLVVAAPIFSFVTDSGIKLGDTIIPWLWFFLIVCLLLIILAFILYRTRYWHHNIHKAHTEKKLPQNVIQQLEELKKYRKKYGITSILIIFFIFSFFFRNNIVSAESLLAPPLITTFSKNISNQEIFYAGGKTDFSNEKVILYFQNLATGETFSGEIDSDNKGDWLYRHSNFLSPGKYLLWAQSKLGGDTSPPGPQIKMTVNRTAIQFGGSRISYETIYLFLSIILFIFVLCLLSFILYHYYHGRKKHIKFQQDVKEAEESIKRGFAVLRRDIEAELAIVKRAKLSGGVLQEEQIREKELLDDLNTVQKQIGKEVWDFESI